MEEFGIENIPAILNKFQKEKREKYFGEIDEEIWVEVQSLSKSLLQQGERAVINTNEYKWFDAHVGSEPGIYWVEHKTKGLIYIGESSNILERYKTHSGTTYFSALRRHIGEIILGFNLKTIKGKKRYFTENEDTKVTNFLRNCSIKPYIVNFGRYELEDYLIGKFKPLLNRKGNK
jgi:hypothetical protein